MMQMKLLMDSLTHFDQDNVVTSMRRSEYSFDSDQMCHFGQKSDVPSQRWTQTKCFCKHLHDERSQGIETYYKKKHENSTNLIIHTIT